MRSRAQSAAALAIAQLPSTLAQGARHFVNQTGHTFDSHRPSGSLQLLRISRRKESAKASRTTTMDAIASRLTSLAHGGGCGCKLAPSVLQDLLADQPAAQPYRHLLVGTETGDDAAVWQLDDNTCVIATTDFFMPVVDDPHDFGRIAATNAISDIYAMGGKPIMALAILGMPIGKISTATVREILRGGADVCAAAGIPVAGGHSIDAPEPIYGLAVIGIGSPERIRRNADARAGDALILTKGLGVGIYSAAFKKDALSSTAYAEMIASTTLLNRIGADLAQERDVHAITDVTGFGLLGHALEMARGSDLTLIVRADDLPLLSEAAPLAQRNFITGASGRNWASYGDSVVLPADLPEWRRHLLTDPQTSGGLLIACAPGSAEALLRTIVDAGYPSARIIGHATAGAPRVVVEA
jgi:selenide,water dikinase